MSLQTQVTTALRAEPTTERVVEEKKYKFEKVWYLDERRSATGKGLKVNQLIIICDPSLVKISVSNLLNYFRKIKV